MDFIKKHQIFFDVLSSVDIFHKRKEQKKGPALEKLQLSMLHTYDTLPP